ncbi:uncharacterized protein LOC141522701 [Macrotis lagotis]|uniref:uncharacterized protein LOC141522701 n=1 Tax=Macrotis lagotis TaxID=92651 RepID=UPI003D68076A
MVRRKLPTRRRERTPGGVGAGAGAGAGQGHCPPARGRLARRSRGCCCCLPPLPGCRSSCCRCRDSSMVLGALPIKGRGPPRFGPLPTPPPPSSRALPSHGQRSGSEEPGGRERTRRWTGGPGDRVLPGGNPSADPPPLHRAGSVWRGGSPRRLNEKGSSGSLGLEELGCMSAAPIRRPGRVRISKNKKAPGQMGPSQAQTRQLRASEGVLWERESFQQRYVFHRGKQPRSCQDYSPLRSSCYSSAKVVHLAMETSFGKTHTHPNPS